eukprot:g9582.t1
MVEHLSENHIYDLCNISLFQENATASLVDGLIQEYGQIDMLHMDIQGGELELLKESKHLLKLGLLDSSCHRSIGIIEPSEENFTISWSPGLANDCVFQAWQPASIHSSPFFPHLLAYARYAYAWCAVRSAMGFAQQLLNHVPHLAHATQLHAEEASQGAASGESGESEVHQAGDFSSTARGAEDMSPRLAPRAPSRSGHACVVSRLGSPKQRFTAVFDTGSGITWVPGADCKSDTCSEHHRFGEFAPGARADGTIHYGTGQVEYVDGRDTLTFCDSHSDPGCHGMKAKQLKVESQPFGMSTNQTDYPFRILPFDGILGLAPSASSGSVMHALKKSNALDRNLFGVYLSEDTHRSGSISFGGIENAHIAPKSPLTWHQIQNDQEWTLAMKDILICDDRPDGVCPAVVDTGSSLITGPSGEVEKLLSKVRLKEDCSNLGKLPNVSLRIADRNGVLTDYPLTPEEYTLKSLDEVPQTGNSEYLKEFPVLGGSGDQVPEVKPRCDPEMGVMDVPGRKWVIGDTFLRRSVTTPSTTTTADWWASRRASIRTSAVFDAMETLKWLEESPRPVHATDDKPGHATVELWSAMGPIRKAGNKEPQQSVRDTSLAKGSQLLSALPMGGFMADALNYLPSELPRIMASASPNELCRAQAISVEPPPYDFTSFGEAPCTVGSMGHPFSCAAPCKYAWKSLGRGTFW